MRQKGDPAVKLSLNRALKRQLIRQKGDPAVPPLLLQTPENP
jgi:hypothetical protein